MRTHKIVVYFSHDEYERMQKVVEALRQVDWTHPQYDELHEKFLKPGIGYQITAGTFVRTATMSLVQWFEQFQHDQELAKRLKGGS